jgi:prepilin-type N-terminal cleavage/methylation domain-containing protein
MKTMKSMKSQQSGFTLVEIAIVLVIIGLLLGGILKGQELINSAKVKNLAGDFKTVPLYIYGYQDRFKAIPGDDGRAITNLPSGTSPAPSADDNGNANGLINGEWNAEAATLAAASESAKFWRAVRATNFAAGPTDIAATGYFPQNVEGGRIGITSANTAQTPITGMSGTYVFCSSTILGKYAKQLDTTLDDGNTASGSIRVRTQISGAATFTNEAATATSAVDDNTPYTVCMVF